MTEVFATVEGHRVSALLLTVPNQGPWHADVDFEGEPEISGRVTLWIGGLALSGTIDGGTFGLQRKARIVAGAGGWGTVVPAKDYHNDAGIKARTIAEDAARAAGEQLGTFIPAALRVGVDYVRQAAPAAQALVDVLGGVPWWVDYDGITLAGARPAVGLDPAAYEVLAYDPRERVVTLAVDDPSKVRIGSIISERMDVPQVVREFELRLGGEHELRVTAWCGGSELGPGRVAGLLQSITEGTIRRRLYGKYRYRVVRMASDRVELQVASARAGLPDVLPISMWPGVAGAHAELAPGAEVLVEFIEGDRAQPIVTGFAGKDGVGFVPTSLTLCGSSQRVARQGDLVQSGGVGMSIIIGLVGTGAPPNQAVVAGVPYPCSFSVNPADVGPLAKPLFGAISTGSPKVRG